jgi:hypothetical protein
MTGSVVDFDQTILGSGSIDDSTILAYQEGDLG